MSANVTTALKRIRDAEAELERVLERDYPVGASVIYDTGNHNITEGDVVAHGSGRIRVRNLSTDREYWISAYRIKEPS